MNLSDTIDQFCALVVKLNIEGFKVDIKYDDVNDPIVTLTYSAVFVGGPHES